VYRALSLAPLLLLLGCSERDLCAEAPTCDENLAINCEPSCTVGPCSTGPHTLECGDNARCSVITGDTSSPRFFRSRALCIEEGNASCDPATAGEPVCEGTSVVTGCSGYKRVIRAPCSQSALYFTDAPACCRGGGSGDGGVPDGGTSTDGGR
jgi:hypothetical protein